MSVTHDPGLDQGQDVGILIALLDEGLQVSDELAECILRAIATADDDIWDISGMDVPAAHHVVGSDGRPLITGKVYLRVTLIGDVVALRMGTLISDRTPISDSTIWLDSTFDRSRLGCGDPHTFLKREIKEALRSAAGDLLAKRLG